MRRYIVHTLVGGGGQEGGFDALDYRKNKNCNAGKLGKYDILSVLPDKFARFLYEFHDFRYSSLDLPPLPADRSDFDVHGAIDNDQVWIHSICLPVIIVLVVVIIVIIGFICIIILITLDLCVTVKLLVHIH